MLVVKLRQRVMSRRKATKWSDLDVQSSNAAAKKSYRDLPAVQWSNMPALDCHAISDDGATYVSTTVGRTASNTYDYSYSYEQHGVRTASRVHRPVLGESPSNCPGLGALLRGHERIAQIIASCCTPRSRGRRYGRVSSVSLEVRCIGADIAAAAIFEVLQLFPGYLPLRPLGLGVTLWYLQLLFGDLQLPA